MKARPWLVVVGVLIGLLVLLPVCVIIPMSFAGGTTFQFPPREFSMRWYENLLTDRAWTAAIRNSFLVGVLTTAFATVIGTMAAVALNSLGPGTSRLLNGLLMAPIIVPNILVALALYATFLQFRLNGTIHGLVIAHTALAIPFVVIAVNTRLATLDPQLRSAALSLGASPIQAFARVTAPLLAPGLLSGALLAFITSFDEVVVSLFLNTPRNTTLPVLMYSSVALDIDPTISAAASVLVVVVSAAILIGQLWIVNRTERLRRR